MPSFSIFFKEFLGVIVKLIKLALLSGQIHANF